MSPHRQQYIKKVLIRATEGRGKKKKRERKKLKWNKNLYITYIKQVMCIVNKRERFLCLNLPTPSIFVFFIFEKGAVKIDEVQEIRRGHDILTVK